MQNTCAEGQNNRSKMMVFDKADKFRDRNKTKPNKKKTLVQKMNEAGKNAGKVNETKKHIVELLDLLKDELLTFVDYKFTKEQEELLERSEYELNFYVKRGRWPTDKEVREEQDDIRLRNPEAITAITGNKEPTIDQIDDWLEEAELNNNVAVGIPTGYSFDGDFDPNDYRK